MKAARRVLICGDRNWTNGVFIAHVLSDVLFTQGIDVVIEGEARGADKLGAAAARQLHIPEDHILKFPADWKKYKLAAGPIRNRQQFNEGKPDLVLAFHNDIANSKGTKDMVKVAMKAGVETHVYTEEGEVNVRVG
jgi:hypothetical protein